MWVFPFFLMAEEETIRIHLDTTPNLMKIPYARKQIKEQEKNKFKKDFPKMIKRMEKIPSWLTTKVGFYSKLLEEAKRCYIHGFYYATTAMIGIATERLTNELFEELVFEINRNKISKKNLFGNSLTQQKRLKLLKNARAIKPEVYEKLNKIREIRNKYIHPKDEKDGKRDSLKVLKIFIEFLNKDFQENYIIRKGKIFRKNK